MTRWKNIEETPLEVSDLGEVRGPQGPRPIHEDAFGYSVTNVGGIPKKVHRLVAQAFLPNPEGYPVVHHKDTDRKNNHYKNLEWTTVAGNNGYNVKPVIKRNILTDETVKEYRTVTEAAKAEGITQPTMTNRIRRITVISEHYWEFK